MKQLEKEESETIMVILFMSPIDHPNKSTASNTKTTVFTNQ